MAAITSTTESWNNHKFSEVESHIKGNYLTTSGNAASLLTNDTSQAADACYSETPGLRFWRYNGTSSTAGASSDGFILSWSWGSGSVGSQLFLDDNPTKNICIRGRSNNGTFTTWATLMHSDNYTSYTVKKDGTGASGTWGINISGSASSATTAGSATSAGKLSSALDIDTTAKLNAFHEDKVFKVGYLNGDVSATFSSTDGMVLSIGVSTQYGHQIHLDDNRNEIWHRSTVSSGTTWNSWVKIIDSGNIGSQSVNYATSAGTATNADKVDGYHATMGNNKPWGTIPVIHTGGWLDIGKQLEFHYDNTTGSDYSTLLTCTGNHGNVVNLPSSAGTLALTSDIPSSLPASDVYSWAKASTKPSYNYGEIGAGVATIGDGTNYLLLRSNTTWRAGMYYHTTGQEALVFSHVNSGTSFIFTTTDPANRTDWTTLTPQMQIKQGCVYINSLIANESTPSYNLYVNGTTCCKDNIEVAAGKRIQQEGGTGDIYIGNSNNSGWIRFQDICSMTSAGDTYWSIRTSGNAVFANVTSNGGVTALSDARHKKVIGDTPITVNDIAKMSSVCFKWTDGNHDDRTYVGSIAQDWEKVLPSVVVKNDNEEGTLSLNYGVAALISSITTARRVVNHEERIKELEEEIKKLKSNK